MTYPLIRNKRRLGPAAEMELDPSIAWPSWPLRRHAFTLFELLIVLALVVVVAGMALTTLRGPISTQQLRSAAEEIRTGLCQVRNRAVRAGQPFVVIAESGASTISVGPWTGLVTTGAGNNGTLRTGGGSVDVSDNADGQLGTQAITLPQGIVIHSTQAGSGTTREDATESQQVLFFPDGTATSTRITLRNDLNEAITVVLHGLTCSNDVSPIFIAERNQR